MMSLLAIYRVLFGLVVDVATGEFDVIRWREAFRSMLDAAILLRRVHALCALSLRCLAARLDGALSRTH